jgi:uncharacterized protein (DUF1800 family)
MDRRSFITSQKTFSKATLNPARTNSGLAPFASDLTTDNLLHLLKRVLFGVKWTNFLSFNNKSLNEVIDALLVADPIPAPPVNTYNDANYTDPNVPLGQTWVNAPYGDGTANSRRITSLKSWWMGLMINQPVTLHEKMVLFWANHFSTEADTVNEARYSYKHLTLIRSFALGNFKQLVKEITLDPAMLKYLNGYLNNKNAPDENYGRELQELFVIGKGPNSKYTEDDVKASAKVLTGYIINAAPVTSSFNPARHDVTNKQFSSFYNNTVIVGKTGNDGALELDAMLDMLFKQNEAALFICRKLYRFFVYYDIDAATETNVIAPMAAIFRSSNYEIKPVLKALFTSTHFFDAVNHGCMIKSPIDFTVGMCREFNMQFPPATDYVNQYYMFDYIRTQASNLQQNIGDPPNVAGWPAYYQEPQFHELWINSDTLPKRNQLTDTMVASGYTRNGKKILIDTVAFVDGLSNPSDPNTLINETLMLLYTIDVSQQVKTFLKSILLSGQISDYYWTDAWTAYKVNVNNTMTKGIVTTRLQAMFKYLMNLSEYQLS